MSEFKSRVCAHDFISCCAELALKAGSVIREVHKARIAGGNSVLEGILKEAGDEKSVATVADLQAQRIIISALRKRYGPELTIVGEEDDDSSMTVNACVSNIEHHPFFTSHCLWKIEPGSLEWNLDQVCIFIDPLDGTHEFVESRVQNVQTLIGISVRGTPVAGIVGLPFWSQYCSSGKDTSLAILPMELDVAANVVENTEKADGAIIAGLVGVGTVGYQEHDNTMLNTSQLRLASSLSIKDPCLVSVQSVLLASPFNGQPTSVPACGNKILSLLQKRCDVAVFNLKTSLWDTCATSAILVAAGGRVTDLMGCNINHSHPSIARNGNAGNIYGVIASVQGVDHDAITASFRTLPEVTALLSKAGLIASEDGSASASDVCRDSYGLPLDQTFLSDTVGSRVTAYTCPETSAQRYLMSHAARIFLKYDNNCIKGPESIFYKRCVMRDLPHVAKKASTTPLKLSRDITSYQVEAAFLSSAACKKLSYSGDVNVASCYRSEQFANMQSPIDSSFTLFLSDFAPHDGWSQSALLNDNQLKVGVVALAKFHAFFWNGGIHNKRLASEDVVELASAVWPVATHWAPSRQAPDMMQNITSTWEKHNYGDENLGFGNGCTAHRNLGKRLQEVATEIAAQCHFDSSEMNQQQQHPHSTIIHGDAKSGNLFYRRTSDDHDQVVGLIDFQWTGFGLGSVDLAYFVASCAQSDAVDVLGEKEMTLLQCYHSTLLASIEKLQRPGSEPPVLPTLVELKNQYENALLDVFRIAGTYHWGRIPASPDVFTSERAGMLGPCAYNKDVGVARWLVHRCDILLREREERDGK